MFQKAEEVEQSETGRSFPMAMWGAAISTTMIIRQHSECERGKEFLQKIQKDAKWLTKKELAYIKTAFAQYPSSVHCNTEEAKFVNVVKRLMKAMGTLMKEFPEESEAALFYVAASTGIVSHSGGRPEDEEIPNDKENVIEILKDLEKKLPTHSGLYHYTLHVFDTPELFTEGNKIFFNQMIQPIDQKDHSALMGFRAAELYPRVANSSCHALHMPSHIYMRSGDWNKSLESNLHSIEVKMIQGVPVHFTVQCTQCLLIFLLI